MNKWMWIGLAVVAMVGFLSWLFVESSKSLPGTKIADLGREHVQIGTKVEYNSNPPTSGKHYDEWIKSGLYTESKDDRNLVHSLEHGYVIMSYRCQGTGDSGQEATESGQVMNRECEERKNKLAQVYEKKGKRKLIVVPRGNLDTNFALTAWIYIDKFDIFDAERVEKFIDVHLNMGPEKTMEN